jgi:hypothetical protein
MYSVHSRYKFKNNNIENIKIASRKLPPDFFRPSTPYNENNIPILLRESTLKTPSFGIDKKDCYSLSRINK